MRDRVKDEQLKKMKRLMLVGLPINFKILFYKKLIIFSLLLTMFVPLNYFTNEWPIVALNLLGEIL